MQYFYVTIPPAVRPTPNEPTHHYISFFMQVKQRSVSTSPVQMFLLPDSALHWTPCCYRQRRPPCHPSIGRTQCRACHRTTAPDAPWSWCRSPDGTAGLRTRLHSAEGQAIFWPTPCVSRGNLWQHWAPNSGGPYFLHPRYPTIGEKNGEKWSWMNQEGKQWVRSPVNRRSMQSYILTYYRLRKREHCIALDSHQGCP